MRSPVYSQRFDRAVALAVDAFRGVRRKGSDVPYVTHLLMVCAIVGEHGGDEDQLIAAVLHDYLEDIPGVFREPLPRVSLDSLPDEGAWLQPFRPLSALLTSRPAQGVA